MTPKNTDFYQERVAAIKKFIISSRTYFQNDKIENGTGALLEADTLLRTTLQDTKLSPALKDLFSKAAGQVDGALAAAAQYDWAASLSETAGAANDLEPRLEKVIDELTDCVTTLGAINKLFGREI